MPKKKKQTCFIYSIPVDIYNTSVAVHITTNKEYLKKLEKSTGEKIEEDATGTTFVDMTGDDPPLMWLRHKPRTFEQIGTLAHEAGHVAKAILKSRGILINDKTEEAYCYLQGYLVKSILKESRKKNV